jgi:hypothetical protein
MKKTLLITIVALFTFSNTYAQLPDGSVAPDWTLTDLNGTSHNLYTYLDDGYTVFIDFSAVWCPPCWSYHQSGALDALYENHGPTGYPHVNSNTTDEVMVFYIEADANNVASLGGNGGNTQGDWITGTSYPIICTDGTVNNNTVSSDYAISYFPTIYMICPDRLITEVGAQPSPYNSVNACPPPASTNDDARTFGYTGETLTCEGDLTPNVTFQNYGLNPLTSLTIDVSVNGSPISSTPWQGNLATYSTDNITLPPLSNLADNDMVEIDVLMPNGTTDANPSNNPTVSFNVDLATQNTATMITVTIITDRYGSETTWDVKNTMGQTIQQGGPYNDLTANGTTPQTPVDITLDPSECHTFTIYDAYGDGINSGYGNGSFTVSDANGTTLASGGTFTDEDGDAWKTGNSSPPSPSWNCVNSLCVDPGDGTGSYSTQSLCQAACGVSSINEVNSKISIFPNPAKNKINIVGAFESLEVYNIYGELVFSDDNTRKNIDLSKFSSGLYTINLNTKEGIIVKRVNVIK